MKADRNADNVRKEANQIFLAKLEARIETNKEKEFKEMWEEIKSGQAEMRFKICAFRSRMVETIQRDMRAVILVQLARSELDETTACNKATKTEPDPRMMQSIQAAVMPVVRERKRDRVCNLAAERRQKRKERTLEYRGSRRKSAATCSTVSRRAKVEWSKRNLLRNVQTQRNCGPCKRLTVSVRKTTSRAKVAWRIENVVRKIWTRNAEPTKR
jgi:hypothetical protein